jgi:transposase
MREVDNGLMYSLSTRCQWRAIPPAAEKHTFTTTSIRGPTTAHWFAFTRRFMSSVANKPNGQSGRRHHR